MRSAVELEVRSPFDGREVGARITDPEEVAAILADHREAFVVRIASAVVISTQEPPPVEKEG